MNTIELPAYLYPTHYTELYCIHPSGGYGASITNCIEPDYYYLKFMHIEDREAWVVRYPVKREDVYRLLLVICPDMVLAEMEFKKQPTGPAQLGENKHYDDALTLGGEPHRLTYGPADNRQAVELAILKGVPITWILTDPELN